MLTQAELKEFIHYDPDTGVMTWKKITGRRAKAGDAAGCVNPRGYIQMGILNKIYFAHRLAFLYQTGEWPPVHVDHINGVKTDNRWCNLRAVTPAENTKNSAMHPRNSSGVTGVFWSHRKKRWCASIRSGGKIEYLGQFSSFDAAVAARKLAESRHGFHENHGRPNESTRLSSQFT